MSDRRIWWLLAASLAIAPALAQPVRLDIPDVELTDHRGAPWRSARDLFQSRVVVVSFVFTGCTTVCSPIGANMGALDHLLGGRTALLSVSLDPFNDTPERLSAWRDQFDGDPGWRLLTGDPDRVARLLHAMRADAPDLSQHDAFLWLGDTGTGRWTRLSALTPPETLAALIRRMEQQ